MPAEFTGFTETEIRTIKKTNVKETTPKTCSKVLKPKPKLNECKQESKILLPPPSLKNDVKDIKEDKINLLPIENGGPYNTSCDNHFDTLEDFERQNREIERQNKKKKKLLLDAISARSKKTKEEQLLLNELSKQLNEIDRSLHVDVSALRNEIDEHSISYMKAQQKYQKAEKDYVQAKSEFHKLAEIKESLTEKLFYTIQQTELRKAKKLSELLESLSLDNNNADTKDSNAETLSITKIISPAKDILNLEKSQESNSCNVKDKSELDTKVLTNGT